SSGDGQWGGAHQVYNWGTSTQSITASAQQQGGLESVTWSSDLPEVESQQHGPGLSAAAGAVGRCLWLCGQRFRKPWLQEWRGIQERGGCEGREEVSSESIQGNRPLMVIHHLEDCPYSQALKKSFAENTEIQKMAREDFVMLNLQFETEDKNLWPDGQYVPRILFVDPSWTVRADIVGQYQNRMYTYEPQDIDILIKNMKTAKILVKTDF
uniref:Anterior gradient protein 3-like protein n=1 Tax=Callorhinchus milii TaxID=7868 RepID=A0A4W3HE59_CALMI